MSRQLYPLRFAFLSAALLGFLGVSPLRAVTFTVTSLADDGPGTLRAQLAASELTGGAVIDFSVSGQINLLSTLTLKFGRRSVYIDGGNRITLSGGGNVQVLGNPEFASTTIGNLTIADGSTPLRGGGIANRGFLNLKNVTFRNNRATLGGGAIWHHEGFLTVDSCTFEGNTADLDSGSGGAILVQVDGSASLTNSTLFDNRAFHGGAIASDYPVQLFNTTIAGNSAQQGGGLSLGPFSTGDYKLKNTIVANNTGGNCFTEPGTTPRWNDLGGNISYPDNTCPGAVVDPKLGPLADNGGPTQTMALLAGSPAIDRAIDCVAPTIVLPFGGASQALTVDQRGFPRPQGAACDTGSYERSAIAFTFTGFFAPIENLPALNVAKAGQAVPISFSVGGYLGMDLIAPDYPASQPVSCETGLPTGPLAAIDTPGASGLQFDTFTNTYTIVWKTGKSWAGTCRQLVLRLTDGVDRTAVFRFR